SNLNHQNHSLSIRKLGYRQGIGAGGPFSPSLATGTLGHPWPAVPSRRPWLLGHSAILGQR
ncbi:hypothetical protein, partial [Desulfosporosinus sp.]|uniref:hypothetical protein n=1 Tax=Desulfosporosinus sp. TaxID=157907 RepID=UPI00262DBA28